MILGQYLNTLRQFLADMRQWCWPSMGWRRFIRYQLIKLSRISGGETVIARGFACGFATSFTPFVGLHFLISGLVAKSIKGNVIAAMIGTMAGNPWTFPFIWSVAFSIGHEILHAKHHNGQFKNELDWGMMLSHPLEIFFPMMLGGTILFVIAWPLGYFGGLHFLRWHKQSRIKRQR